MNQHDQIKRGMDRDAISAAKQIAQNGLKFVQIAVGLGAEGEQSLIGLTADGDVYEYRTCKERLPGEATRKAKCSNGGYMDYAYSKAMSWWQPLRMSTDKGEEFEIPATPASMYTDD